MLVMPKKSVNFKQFFRNVHCELQKTIYITAQYVGMHHANMVCSMVAGLQQVLQQLTAHIESHVVMQEPQVYHVENSL